MLCVDVYCVLSFSLLFHRLNHPVKPQLNLHNWYVVVYYVYPPTLISYTSHNTVVLLWPLQIALCIVCCWLRMDSIEVTPIFQHLYQSYSIYQPLIHDLSNPSHPTNCNCCYYPNQQQQQIKIIYTHCQSNYNHPNSKQPILIYLTTPKLIAIICLVRCIVVYTTLNIIHISRCTLK